MPTKMLRRLIYNRGCTWRVLNVEVVHHRWKRGIVERRLDGVSWLW